MIYLAKQGVTFNKVAAELYGLGGTGATGLMVLTKESLVGFKAVDIDGDPGEVYPVRDGAKGGKGGKYQTATKVIGCQRFKKKFPDRVGRHYRLHKDTSNGVIIADLNAPVD